ncbi:hypothetical protein PIB30_018796 [Stylosanthes scabra]|uniref:Sulfotransferase n=1 Tax=Stylosanthes scabra TaxID=79078 RepID=A0ABU6R8B8_9FABA|nr:hypothetical protein [Stylosanthes scabra]
MEARSDQPPTNLPKPQQQDENLSQEFKNLMSTLPMDEGWLSTIPVYQYQGFWFEPMFLQAILSCQKHFEANDTDIIHVTFPKSGTTWLKALTFALLNRNKYPPTQENNPLLVTNPHILVPPLHSLFYDEKFNIPNISQFPSPRLLSSHFPYISLPKSRKEFKWTILGSCFGVLERKLGKARESNVSKVYEQMKSHPTLVLKELSEFIGCSFSQQELDNGMLDDILNLCSFDNLRNLEVNQTGSVSSIRGFEIQNKSFFRCGKIGDSKNFLTND